MKQIKILVIDDDPHICELIKLYGETNGYQMISAYDGMEGLERFFDETPDLVILDIMLPEMDGWQLCKSIRADKPTPIIMLTGKGESYDRIKGLDLGADDYMVKPFDPKELMARIKAVLRRGNQLPETKEVIEFPSLRIDPNQYHVICRGTEFTLPPKEMELLYFFATYPNQVFTRQQLLDKVWGFDFHGDPRTVDVHIKRIREKLGDHTQWSLKTIRGIGYKFEVKSD
ncbi:response regulator transcription factor [Effusibacillus consociatus]|uniref:Response regulator transcription factor n=1 Tax=Effusibacillus consociatus TaxID=1117041 RepID=A0ABV9Q212_9BACL